LELITYSKEGGKLMAITSTPVLTDMAIVYEQAGKFVTRRFADVKVAAADADIYDVVAGLAGINTLQDLTMAMLERINTNELENA